MLLELADWIRSQFVPERHRRRRSRRQKGFSLLWIPVILIGLVAVIRYLLGHLFTELEILFEFQVFRIALILPALVILVLALMQKRLIQGGVTLAILVLLVGEMLHYVSFLPQLPRSPHARADLRVFTQNVGMNSPDKWRAWLEENPMDLLMLEEVYAPSRKDWETLAADFGYYHHWEMVRSDAGMGGMIISRYPLIAMDPISGVSTNDKKRYFLRAQIDLDGVPVELIGVHLESLCVDKITGGRNWFDSSPVRQQQAYVLGEVIKVIIEHTGNPIIVAGDFNASPTFRSVADLRAPLQDAWLQAGSGLGGTFPVALAMERIDAILFHGFVAENASVTPVVASDHRGVTAVLNLLPEEIQ